MKPDQRFLAQDKTFWANVRTMSEQAGYTERGEGVIKIPTLEEILAALTGITLGTSHIVDAKTKNPTVMGQTLLAYFKFRADTLNDHVEPRLMDAERAKEVFNELKGNHWKRCPLPMNKQKGDKKAEAYLTCIVNLLIEAHSDGYGCDHDPRVLTTVTKDNAPLRTLARRVDGGFPLDREPHRRLGDQGILLHDHVRQSGSRWRL